MRVGLSTGTWAHFGHWGPGSGGTASGGPVVRVVGNPGIRLVTETSDSWQDAFCCAGRCSLWSMGCASPAAQTAFAGSKVP